MIIRNSCFDGVPSGNQTWQLNIPYKSSFIAGNITYKLRFSSKPCDWLQKELQAASQLEEFLWLSSRAVRILHHITAPQKSAPLASGGLLCRLRLHVAAPTMRRRCRWKGPIWVEKLPAKHALMLSVRMFQWYSAIMAYSLIVNSQEYLIDGQK